MVEILCGGRGFLQPLSPSCRGEAFAKFGVNVRRFIFVIQTVINFRKNRCLSHVMRPFLSPLQGLLPIPFYQGLHPCPYTFSPSGLL